MRRVYIIAGTPGVGKTTIGRRVAEHLGLRLLELSEMVGHGAGGEADPRALSARAGSRIRKSRSDVLIATHIIFKPRGYRPTAVIVLRRNPFYLLEELRKRGYPESRVLENVEAELLGLVYAEALRLYGKRRVRQIDASSRELERVAEVVGDCLIGRCVGEEVDWLTILEKSGELDSLLAQLSRRL